MRDSVKRLRRCFCLAAALVAAGSSPVGASYTTVVENGPSANRVDIVFLGDGYTTTDLAAGAYQGDVLDYVSYMFADSLNSEPFHRYRNFFNVHAVEVISQQTGADAPPLGVYRDTALDAAYFSAGIERLLTVNELKARAARDAALADADFSAEMQFVTVNDARYGGSGGAFAVFAGGNGAANEIALHEIAHSFSRLADEYGGAPGPYAGPEPAQINVTKDPSGAKWAPWLGYNQPGVGVIGAYEGGLFYDAGVYRPSNNSKMRQLSQPFDAVGREQIILDIYDLVNPFDSWSDNSSPLVDPEPLTVAPVDNGVISVEWFVDEEPAPAGSGTTFDLAAAGYPPGEYVVTARGYDPTAFDPLQGWVRRAPDNLEQFIRWNVTLTAAAPTGDFDSDGDVDAADFLAWQGGLSPDPWSPDDLQVWQDRFGVGVAPEATGAIPEPATILLLMAAVPLALRRPAP